MSLTQLFWQINENLLQNPKPSEYLSEVFYNPLFREYPFELLYNLRNTQQSPKHHPEGNVWNHTLLVVDEAAKLKSASKDSPVFLWAALLHDIGKPSTTKNRKGKITAYNHDKVGALLARDFLNEFLDKEKFIDEVVHLVRWHMQILFVVKDLPFRDIDTMKQQTDINEVALLGLCDRLGRSNVNKELERNNIRIFRQKCNS